MLGLVLAGCSAAPRENHDEEPALSPDALAERGRQLNLAFGLRSFDEDDWENLADQALFVLDYAEPIQLGNVRLEGGLRYSCDDSGATLPGGERVELRAQTWEVSAGLNAGVLLGRLRPYVGAGGSLLFVDTKTLDASGDVDHGSDETAGGYAKAGLLLQISPKAHFGAEYRMLHAGEVSFGGEDADATSQELVLVFGTSF